MALRRFTHAPVPMHRGVVIDMRNHIEKQHGQDWMDAMLSHDRIMEYTTYGTYARHIDELRRVCPARPELSLYFWWAEQAAGFRKNFSEAARTSGSTPTQSLILRQFQNPWAPRLSPEPSAAALCNGPIHCKNTCRVLPAGIYSGHG